MSELSEKVKRLESLHNTLHEKLWQISGKIEALGLADDAFASDADFVERVTTLLQELADRRRAESAPTISLDDWYQKLPVVTGYIQCDRCRLIVEPDDLDIERHYLRKCTDKPTTYDERDMQKAKYPVGSAVLDREFLFHQLRTCLNELGLVSVSATDQTAFIAIRDILHAHAQDKSYDARYGAKTATNASKEQGRAFLEPSSKV